MDKMNQAYSRAENKIRVVANKLLDNVDNIKLERQIKCLHKWLDNKGIGIIEASPGFGKSLLLYSAIYDKDLRKKRKSILLVPSEALKIQHQKNINKLNIDNCTIMTISTALKNNDLKCDVLLVDEVHNLYGLKSRTLLKSISYRFFLGVKPSGDYSNKNSIDIPLIDKITSRESALLKYTIPVERSTLKINMTTENALRYARLTEEIEKYGKLFNNNIEIAKRCLRPKRVSKTLDNFQRYKGNITNYNSKSNYYIVDASRSIAEQFNMKRESVIGCAVKYFNCIRQRIDMLKNSDEKIDKAIEIIQELIEQRNRIIVFHGSIVSAEKMHGSLKIRSLTYHSKNKPKENKNNLEAFRKGIIKVLNCVEGLNEGMDIPSLDTSIILYGNSSNLSQFQRSGRLERVYEKLNPIEIHLILKDTIEQFKYERRVSE